MSCIFKPYIHVLMLGTKPAITIHPHSHAVTLASDTECLQLTCQAVRGSSYNWERQDGSIPSGAIGVYSNTLIIVNLTPEDVGNYRCVVSDGSDRSFSNYATVYG